MVRNSSSVRENDERLLRRIGILVPLWTALFVVASVALVLYGDVLLELFT